MVMNINPQIADDISQVEDTVLAMATLSGEHIAVMERVTNRHTLPQGTGQTFKVAHVGKMEAMLGGPRTRWTQVQPYTARVYEIPLQYAAILTKIGDDMKQFLSARFIARIGSQAGNGLMRIVDKFGLALFPQMANINGNGGANTDKVKYVGVLDDMFAIQASPDDSDSPMVGVMPTAFIRDLNKELLALGADQTLQRPTPQGPQARLINSGPRYDFLGLNTMEARNSEKYGSTGYGATFRRNAIDYVTARTMSKERVRDGFQGGGSWIVLMRKLFGMRISPWADENWIRVQRRAMDIGGS